MADTNTEKIISLGTLSYNNTKMKNWSAVNHTNPNLLINPDFSVNQRGNTEYSGDTEYGVDGWKIYKEGKMSVVSGGIVVNKMSDTSVGGIWQPNELLFDLIGKTVTLSVMIDGNVYSKSMVVPSSGQSEVLTAPNGNWFLYKQPNYIQISCICTENTNVINRVKIEQGSIATAFSPPNYSDEMAKCQRYYQIRSTGDVAVSDLRPIMRISPTITKISDGKYGYSAEL